MMSAFPLVGQGYYPMPEGPAQWDITRCWSFFPGGWHDEYSVTMDGTDTLINNKSYKKLYLTTHHLPGTQFDSVYTQYLGAMRESGRQVYMLSEYLCLDTIERMIYDFNPVEVGDTIHTQILTHGLTHFIPHIVTAIEEISTQDGLRRRIHMTDESGFNTESWTEGIGSSMGLIYASYWTLTDNSYDLNCFYMDHQLEWTNPEPTYLFCLSPLPDITCEPLTGIPDHTYAIVVSPNPAIDYISVTSDAPVSAVELYDVLGHQLLRTEETTQVDINELPAGAYVIKLISTAGDLPARWLIKL